MANHTTATMFALPGLGLTLAASGRYDEAESAFAEAIRFGREYGIGTLLARAMGLFHPTAILSHIPRFVRASCLVK